MTNAMMTINVKGYDIVVLAIEALWKNSKTESIFFFFMYEQFINFLFS